MRPIPKIEDYKNSDRNEGGTFTYDLMKWAKEAEKKLNNTVTTTFHNRILREEGERYDERIEKLQASNSERQLKIEQLEDKLNQTSNEST